ncbi:MAG: hypothetical protein IJW55_02090 [Clostridia bacterium]|nr:hypothetical protein [Clostridia bacterium]
MLRILIEIGVALFAVFGFCCALKTFFELLFASERIAVAVEVREKKDADMLDMLLHEAQSAFLRKGHARLVVLLSTELMDGTVGTGEELADDYAELIDRYGAECYLIDPE